ncbi:hypothetical protein [Rhizobium jaguaris]|uniref:hypothetical protein n=1 Tax=Rhizobium jaguaris TaxID=1312183 RepID=UPI001FDF5C0D|nr:hypothetical protein [Rhizobium jaguaris]
MVQMRGPRRATGLRASRSFPLLWLALAVAAALLAWLAISAVKSGGLDRLLPKDQPFAPYFTT